MRWRRLRRSGEDYRQVHGLSKRGKLIPTFLYLSMNKPCYFWSQYLDEPDEIGAFISGFSKRV